MAEEAEEVLLLVPEVSMVLVQIMIAVLVVLILNVLGEEELVRVVLEVQIVVVVMATVAVVAQVLNVLGKMIRCLMIVVNLIIMKVVVLQRADVVGLPRVAVIGTAIHPLVIPMVVLMI